MTASPSPDHPESRHKSRSALALRREKTLWRKKLDAMLSRADAAGFLRMIWALHAIDAGEFKLAAKYGPDFTLQQMKEANEKFYFKPWTLETIVNEYLTVHCQAVSIRDRKLNTSARAAALHAINAMQKLENAEDGLWLRKGSVLQLMGHLAQRQFPWQRGLGFFLEFYRPLFIFDFPEAHDAFLQRTRVSMGDFAHVGFALMANSMHAPFVATSLDLSVIGVSEDVRNSVIGRLAISIDRARHMAREIRSKPGLAAYKPSILRRYPCIVFPEVQKLIAPLPDLISNRIGEGIYYDVVGEGAISNRAGKRFEEYVRLILSLHFPKLNVLEEDRYVVRKGLAFDTPDVRLAETGEIFAVIECKARRASHAARFADAPEHASGLEELAKGVFQIWRFFSHCRQGLCEHRIHPQASGVLLTLDTWADMSDATKKDIFRRANLLADQIGGLSEEDRRPVGLTHVRDLEGTLASATQASFQETLTAWTLQGEYNGWGLWAVHQRQHGDPERDSRREHLVFDRLPRPEAMQWWKLSEG